MQTPLLLTATWLFSLWPCVAGGSFFSTFLPPVNNRTVYINTPSAAAVAHNYTYSFVTPEYSLAVTENVSGFSGRRVFVSANWTEEDEARKLNFRFNTNKTHWFLYGSEIWGHGVVSASANHTTGRATEEWFGWEAASYGSAEAAKGDAQWGALPASLVAVGAPVGSLFTCEYFELDYAHPALGPARLVTENFTLGAYLPALPPNASAAEALAALPRYNPCSALGQTCHFDDGILECRSPEALELWQLLDRADGISCNPEVCCETKPKFLHDWFMTNKASGSGCKLEISIVGWVIIAAGLCVFIIVLVIICMCCCCRTQGSAARGAGSSGACCTRASDLPPPPPPGMIRGKNLPGAAKGLEGLLELNLSNIEMQRKAPAQLPVPPVSAPLLPYAAAPGRVSSSTRPDLGHWLALLPATDAQIVQRHREDAARELRKAPFKWPGRGWAVAPLPASPFGLVTELRYSHDLQKIMDEEKAGKVDRQRVSGYLSPGGAKGALASVPESPARPALRNPAPAAQPRGGREAARGEYGLMAELAADSGGREPEPAAPQAAAKGGDKKFFTWKKREPGSAAGEGSKPLPPVQREPSALGRMFGRGQGAPERGDSDASAEDRQEGGDEEQGGKDSGKKERKGSVFGGGLSLFARGKDSEAPPPRKPGKLTSLFSRKESEAAAEQEEAKDSKEAELRPSEGGQRGTGEASKAGDEAASARPKKKVELLPGEEGYVAGESDEEESGKDRQQSEAEEEDEGQASGDGDNRNKEQGKGKDDGKGKNEGKDVVPKPPEQDEGKGGGFFGRMRTFGRGGADKPQTTAAQDKDKDPAPKPPQRKKSVFGGFPRFGRAKEEAKEEEAPDKDSHTHKGKDADKDVDENKGAGREAGDKESERDEEDKELGGKGTEQQGGGKRTGKEAGGEDADTEAGGKEVDEDEDTKKNKHSDKEEPKTPEKTDKAEGGFFSRLMSRGPSSAEKGKEKDKSADEQDEEARKPKPPERKRSMFGGFPGFGRGKQGEEGKDKEGKEKEGKEKESPGTSPSKGERKGSMFGRLGSMFGATPDKAPDAATEDPLLRDDKTKESERDKDKEDERDKRKDDDQDKRKDDDRDKRKDDDRDKRKDDDRDKRKDDDRDKREDDERDKREDERDKRKEERGRDEEKGQEVGSSDGDSERRGERRKDERPSRRRDEDEDEDAARPTEHRAQRHDHRDHEAAAEDAKAKARAKDDGVEPYDDDFEADSPPARKGKGKAPTKAVEDDLSEEDF